MDVEMSLDIVFDIFVCYAKYSCKLIEFLKMKVSCESHNLGTIRVPILNVRDTFQSK